MPFALARSLLLADAVSPEALAEALLLSATRGTSLVRALLATRAIEPLRLEQHLERGDAPYMRHVVPVMSLVQHLPPGLCERLLAVPVRRDPRTGTIDVAVVDARDSHAVEEVAHWLKAPTRMVRTSLASMEAALRRMHVKPEAGVRPLAPPIWVPAPHDPPAREPAQTPLYGVPAADVGEALRAGRSEDIASFEDESPTEVVDFGIAAPNIPIALTRPVPIFELGPPAIEMDARKEPVLDLRRRKPTSQPLPAAQPVSGPLPPPRPPPRRVSSVPPAVPPPAAQAVPAPEPPPLPLSAPSSPFAPNAPAAPFEDATPVLDEIRAASDRDAILELLVRGVRTAARKVGVLAVKRDLLAGWTCSPELADRAVFRTARLPPDGTVLLDVLEGDGARLMRIPKDATHAPLLSVMKLPPSGEVALIAVRVEGKPVALVLADEMGDTLVVTKRMEDLARAAGDALAALLRERRRA